MAQNNYCNRLAYYLITNFYKNLSVMAKTHKKETVKETPKQTQSKSEEKPKAAKPKVDKPDIVQPKEDENQTQAAAKANAKKGEPIPTALGTGTLARGINVNLEK